MLKPTALAHDAFFRVYGGTLPSQCCRRLIVATLARATRCVLADFARKRSAAKPTMPVAHSGLAFDLNHYLAADVITFDASQLLLANDTDKWPTNFHEPVPIMLPAEDNVESMPSTADSPVPR